jgi:hypothetical protein
MKYLKVPRKIFYLEKLFVKLRDNSHLGWYKSHQLTLHIIEYDYPYGILNPPYIKIYPENKDIKNYVEILFEESKYNPINGTIVVNIKNMVMNENVGEPFRINCWLWNDIHFDIIQLTQNITESLLQRTYMTKSQEDYI